MADDTTKDTPATGTTDDEPTPHVNEGSKDEPQEAGDALKRALQAEREAAKAARREARQARADLQAATERIEALTAQLADTEGQADKVKHLEGRLLRYEVAAEKGLDLKLAARLTGATREELAADADELLSLVAPRDADFDGGPQGDRAPKKQDPKAAHRDFVVGLLRGEVPAEE